MPRRGPGFPPGSRLPFRTVFDLPEGRLTATGEATVVSKDVRDPKDSKDGKGPTVVGP